MSTLQLPLNDPPARMSGTMTGERLARRSRGSLGTHGETNQGPSVFLVFAFFLALASVAVVVVSGQFPWFIVAPITVLLLVSHFRRVEASLARKSSV